MCMIETLKMPLQVESKELAIKDPNGGSQQ
jgi:hypothetical protein